MKILAISDIHGDLRLVKKLEKLIDKEEVDMVLLAGDQTWFSQNTKDLVGPLTKKPALIIPSNHENEETIKSWEKMYPNLKNIHKKSLKINGIGFFGSGTMDWGSKENSKKIFKELKDSHEKIKNLHKKIMVTHVPPSGSKIELMGFPGSEGVKKAIKKFSPNFLICGHIHEGGELIEKIYETTVMNVSRSPTIFEI